MITWILIRYDGLAVKDIIEWADTWHPVIFDYLPHRKLELPKTPKQWLVNVFATILKENFTKWVDEQMDCLLYTSPSPRDQRGSRMPSSA